MNIGVFNNVCNDIDCRMSNTAPAIGIDLGTTCSCVGVWLHGQVQILPNSHSNWTTPSYVAFTKSGRLIGDAAKDQGAFNPKNTIFNAKRFIGRLFKDPVIQQNMKYWPFTIVNEASKPKFQVEYQNKMKMFSPEEISSMVLTKMKETAETYLGYRITDAVITVPAYFNDSQRQATKDAGAIAGLNVLRIMNEPSAAALAYGLEHGVETAKTVLVFDLGGGTLDVSILRIRQGSVFEVLSTAGNTHLGGEDFDNRLVNHLKEEFQRKHGKDISSNPRALSKLRTEAERAKRILSSSTETYIEIDNLVSGIDFHTKISRVKFEEICTDLFRSTWIPLEEALVGAELIASAIQEIILVGGSTRIPKIQSLLRSFFHGKQLNLLMNPDEIVAYGAAVQAAILSGNNCSILRNVLVTDISPISVGIETAGGVMTPLIKRNSRVPCEKSRKFSTSADYQNKVIIAVYEGEQPLVKNNNLLGIFELKGIPPAPRGVPQIEVVFKMDASGILNVTAKDGATGNTQGIVIKNEIDRLPKEELEKMIKEAEEYHEDDLKQGMKIAAKNNLESYIFLVKEAVREAEGLSVREKKIHLNECEEALNWLDADTLHEQGEYENRLKILKMKTNIVDHQ